METTCTEEVTLTLLKQQLDAWERRLQRLDLPHKRRFVAWLSRALTPREFALLLDGELDRRTMWEIYLTEMFGP